LIASCDFVPVISQSPAGDFGFASRCFRNRLPVISQSLAGAFANRNTKTALETRLHSPRWRMEIALTDGNASPATNLLNEDLNESYL
jgi:hypothetical protein